LARIKTQDTPRRLAPRTPRGRVSLKFPPDKFVVLALALEAEAAALWVGALSGRRLVNVVVRDPGGAAGERENLKTLAAASRRRDDRRRFVVGQGAAFDIGGAAGCLTRRSSAKKAPPKRGS
jgi:hypothetical protein